jgi:hypothetical protein
VGGDRAAPEVFVGDHQGGLAVVDDRGEAGFDVGAIEWFGGSWGLARGEVLEVGEGEEAGIVVFDAADEQNLVGAWAQISAQIGAEAEVVAGEDLGDEAVAVGAAVEVEGLGGLEDLLGVAIEEGFEVGEAGHRSAGGNGWS